MYDTVLMYNYLILVIDKAKLNVNDKPSELL